VVKVLQRFRDIFCPYLQVVAEGLVKPILTARTPVYDFWFYQAVNGTLKMETESVPERLDDFHPLTRLSAREGFIEFCCRGRFRTYNVPIIIKIKSKLHTHTHTHTHYTRYSSSSPIKLQAYSATFPSPRPIISAHTVQQGKRYVHPCTGTEARYRPYGPYRE